MLPQLIAQTKDKLYALLLGGEILLLQGYRYVTPAQEELPKRPFSLSPASAEEWWHRRWETFHRKTYFYCLYRTCTCVSAGLTQSTIALYQETLCTVSQFPLPAYIHHPGVCGTRPSQGAIALSDDRFFPLSPRHREQLPLASRAPLSAPQVVLASRRKGSRQSSFKKALGITGTHGSDASGTRKTFCILVFGRAICLLHLNCKNNIVINRGGISVTAGR